MHGSIDWIADLPLRARPLPGRSAAPRLLAVSACRARARRLRCFVYRRPARRGSVLKDFVGVHRTSPGSTANRSARLDYWFFYLNAVVFGPDLAPLDSLHPTVAAFVVADMLRGPTPVAGRFPGRSIRA